VNIPKDCWILKT